LVEERLNKAVSDEKGDGSRVRGLLQQLERENISLKERLSGKEGEGETREDSMRREIARLTTRVLLLPYMDT